jgi:hypothetical protein
MTYGIHFRDRMGEVLHMIMRLIAWDNHAIPRTVDIELLVGV